MNLIDTIVVPQGVEYQAVSRGLNRARVKDMQIISIPIGTKNLRDTLADRNFEVTNPQKILLLGLCGSLTPKYSVGDVLLYQNCKNLTHQQIDLTPELNQLIQQNIAPELVTGITSDRPISSVSAKIQLAKTYSAMAVDLESYGYIQELQARGMAVATVRIVSDDLGGDIPDLSQTIDKEGNLKAASLGIAFWRQPLAALRLIKGSLKALKILEQITYQLAIIVKES